MFVTFSDQVLRQYGMSAHPKMYKLGYAMPGSYLTEYFRLRN